MNAFRPSRTFLLFATIPLALGLAACDTAVPALAPSETALASAATPTILAFPGEDPGPPYYANFFSNAIFGDFIPTDDGRVGISFVRDPGCIPPDFDLLAWVNPPTPPSPTHPPDPGAFGCDLTVAGTAWYDDPTPGTVPYKVQVAGRGVPIYFVDRTELADAMSGGLRIGELQALSSLVVGTADRYRQVIHNSNHGAGFGHEVLNSGGTLEDGRRFQFSYNEQFDPDTGERTFRAVRIQFK